MANLTALKNEIDSDPLTRGYSGMTDAQVADDLNTEYRTENLVTMTASDIMNAINIVEWNALSSTQQQLIWDLLHIGDLNPFGIEATLFINTFGGGSTTISTLAGLRQISISRAVELSLGRVAEGTVKSARAL